MEYCSEYYKNPIYGHLHEAMRANFQECLGGIDACFFCTPNVGSFFLGKFFGGCLKLEEKAA